MLIKCVAIRRCSTMADRSLTDKVNDRILWYALQLQKRWEEEIEQAIDRLKNCEKRDCNNRWFRKIWYISQAKDRKKMCRRNP